MSTLYASFVEPKYAERAAGALLDHGARPEDISVLANERTTTGQPVPVTSETDSAEHSAKTGISTTTPADVAVGTMKGATFGIGLGALAAAASLFIPGIGLVVGGGALATAMMAAAGTALAGAAAGGVAGFLADQGVPEDIVTRYSKEFMEGGAILALAMPSGDLTSEIAEGVLVKYGATNVATVNAPRVLAEGVAPAAVMAPEEPLVVAPENPAIAPVAFAPAVSTTMDTAIVETHVSGPAVEVIDPVSGVTVQRPVTPVVPAVGVVPPGTPVVNATTLPPNPEVVADVAGGLHQTVGHPTVINEQPVVVTDPVTGQQQRARVVEEQRAVVQNPAAVDRDGHVVLPIEGPEETAVVREKHIEYEG